MPALFRFLAIVVLMAGSGAANAQTWPAKPVRFINAFAAGSAPDIVSRVIADRASRDLGQQVIVDNRPGAAGIIAAQAVAHAPADGYTFFFATTAPLVTNPLTFKALPYNPAKDFTPVALVGKNPFLILVGASVPAKMLKDLIDIEKSHPGELSFASDGPRNFSGMVGAWLNKVAGIHMVQVPYANITQGIQDTMAGRTQVIILAFAAARSFMADGRLRALAVTGPEKIPGFESVPPVSDTYPGFEFHGWFGIVAPAGILDDVVLKMNRAVDRALQDPEVSQKLTEIGVYNEGASTPSGFASFIRSEDERWKKVVDEIGLQPE